MSPSTPKANLAASEQPFVLAPPPSWLAALVPGSPPVLAWCVGRSLVLRAGTAWFEVFEGELRRVEPSSPPVRRVPVALSADQAARVRTFAQRLRWLRGESGTRYTPTAREARLHASLSELRRLRSPADATVRRAPGDDATGRALALWVHLIGGRWAPVFEAIDAEELHAGSPWIEPVSLGVAGDVARLREVAASANSRQPPRKRRCCREMRETGAA